MGVVITGAHRLCRLRQQLPMRDKRLLADRGKNGWCRWKLLPDGAVATLVKPVEYRLYRFSMACRVVMLTCLRGRVLMMVSILVT